MITINQDITPLEYDYLLNNIHGFNKKTSKEKFNFIDTVIKNHHIFVLYTNIQNEIFRVRNIEYDTTIKEYWDVLWPPSGKGKDTRFGDYCYVSSYPFIALSETETPAREIAALTAFRMRESHFLKMLPIGELNNISRYGVGHALTEENELNDLCEFIVNLEKVDREHSLCLVLQESFLFHMLSGGDRILSQYTIDKLLTACGGDVKIIGYPSFSVPGGYNFAISTDVFLDIFTFHSIKKCRVDRLPYNLYRCHPLEHVESIHDQTLIWREHSGDRDVDIILQETPRPKT